MIDENFKPWLIEVNNNPCLETSCSLLNRIIPQVIENVFRIAVDPMFPPPKKVIKLLILKQFSKSKFKYFSENYFESNKFELIFDSVEERKIMSGFGEDILDAPNEYLDDDEEVEGDE